MEASPETLVQAGQSEGKFAGSLDFVITRCVADRPGFFNHHVAGAYHKLREVYQIVLGSCSFWMMCTKMFARLEQNPELFFTKQFPPYFHGPDRMNWDMLKMMEVTQDYKVLSAYSGAMFLFVNRLLECMASLRNYHEQLTIYNDMATFKEAALPLLAETRVAIEASLAECKEICPKMLTNATGDDYLRFFSTIQVQTLQLTLTTSIHGQWV